MDTRFASAGSITTDQLNILDDIINNLDESVLALRFFRDGLIVAKSTLEFEPYNFRVDSSGWKSVTNKGSWLRSPEGDIWEVFHGMHKGEQLFTWEAAVREVGKTGKKIPTSREFSELMKNGGMPNIVHVGGHYPDYGSLNCYLSAYFWSSFGSGLDARACRLNFSCDGFRLNLYRKLFCFSVRCLKV